MHFARSLLLVGAVAVSLVASHPAQQLERRIAMPDSLSNFNNLLKRLAQPDASTPTAPDGTCYVGNAQMPQAPTPLPPPSAGLVLSHVAIGRGTQNYTCANSSAQAVPAAAGALASLFNATCIASPYPQLLSAMPKVALKFPTPLPVGPAAAATAYLSGHHYFADAVTPFFDLNTPLHDYGSVACRKVNASPAPNPSADVPWLKLQTKSADGCTIAEVYRVNTAGGLPPPTCEGQQPNVYVQYAAEYWFYGTG